MKLEGILAHLKLAGKILLLPIIFVFAALASLDDSTEEIP